MTDEKTKLHVGSGGQPRKCVAKVVPCPLAPPHVHFDKVEQAQEFADRLNEIRATVGKNVNRNINDKPIV